MNKKQARKLAFMLALFLVIIIGITIWVAIAYGLGSEERELSQMEGEAAFKSIIRLESYDDFVIEKVYEYIDKNHKNKYLHFLIAYENQADLPLQMNLDSQPINFEVIKSVFYAFPTPDWWQPDSVRRGFYYSGVYREMTCDVIIDSEKQQYFLLVQVSN